VGAVVWLERVQQEDGEAVLEDVANGLGARAAPYGERRPGRDAQYLGEVGGVLVVVAVDLWALGDLVVVDQEAHVIAIFSIALCEAAADLVHAARLEDNGLEIFRYLEVPLNGMGRAPHLKGAVPRDELLVRRPAVRAERQVRALSLCLFEALYFIPCIAKLCLEYIHVIQLEG
jgi:hypothetical protein